MIALALALQVASAASRIAFPAELKPWHFSDLASFDCVALVRPKGASQAIETACGSAKLALDEQSFAVVDMLGGMATTLTVAVPAVDPNTPLYPGIRSIDPSTTYLLVARKASGGKLEFRDTGANASRPLAPPVIADCPDSIDAAGFLLIPTKARHIDHAASVLTATLEAFGDAVGTGTDDGALLLSQVWDNICIDDLLKGTKVDGTEARKWMRENFCPQVVAGFAKLGPLSKLAAMRIVRYCEMRSWDKYAKIACDAVLDAAPIGDDWRGGVMLDRMGIEGAMGGPDALTAATMLAKQEPTRIALISNFDKAPPLSDQRALFGLLDQSSPAGRFSIYDALAQWHDDAANAPKYALSMSRGIANEPALRAYWKQKLEG